jgi:hypothetical protein
MVQLQVLGEMQVPFTHGVVQIGVPQSVPYSHTHPQLLSTAHKLLYSTTTCNTCHPLGHAHTSGAVQLPPFRQPAPLTLTPVHSATSQRTLLQPLSHVQVLGAVQLPCPTTQDGEQMGVVHAGPV